MNKSEKKTKKGTDIMPAEDLMQLLHNIDLLHKTVQKNNANSASETDDFNSNIHHLTDENSEINNHVSVSEIQSDVISQSDKKKNKSKQKKKSSECVDEQNNIECADNITPTFKNNILSYIKIDDLIKEKFEEVKELKDAKKKYEEEILNYLNVINQTSINYGEIVLRKNEYTSKGSLKNEYIREVVGNEIKDPMVLEKMIENLENKKIEAATKRLGLKRTKRNTSN